jgi:hypothetical protein
MPRRPLPPALPDHDARSTNEYRRLVAIMLREVDERLRTLETGIANA